MAASLTRICSAILAGLMQFVVVSSAVAQETTTYTYDALGRVTGVAHNGGPEAGAAAIYAYDPAGNRANYQATTDARFSISDVISNEGSPLVFTVSRLESQTIRYPSIMQAPMVRPLLELTIR